MVIFQNILSLKEISCMQWLFWVIYQNKKKGSGANFW